MKKIVNGSFLKKPTKVELFENDQLKLILTKSSKGSLNNIKGISGRTYSGRANKAKIYGKAGSMVTFYDDQKFRKGENYVTFIKLNNDPVEITLNKNFIDESEEAGDKVYYPKPDGKKEKDFEWIFVKRVKPGFWGSLVSTIIPFADWNDIRKLLNYLEDWDVPYVKTVSKKVLKTSSKNYRVDNCSSVEFGSKSATESK